MIVKIVNKSSNPLPEFKTQGSAGMDICANLVFDPSTDEPTTYTEIPPGATYKIPTGIYMEIPVGYECQVRTRSGMASKGICVANSPGTIDSDYRGEICVLLKNNNDQYYYPINHGDRIAQLVFNKIEQPELYVVEELSSTERGEGGFGSTGMT